MRLALLAVLSTGCATLGWRAFPKTRTYTYDTPVSIEVRSEPEGATIVDETGSVVGTAPMTLPARHPVERTRTSRSGRGIALGCLADVVLGVAGMVKWGSGVITQVDDGTLFGRTDVDVFSSTQQRALLIGSSLLLMDCMVTAINSFQERRTELETRDSLQIHARAGERAKVVERAKPRTIWLEARWPDWSPVKGSIVVPDHSLLTLRRGHAGTFDDALVRHARAGKPLDADGLYQVGQVYVRMARETKARAHAEQAIAHFERYLATDNVADARRTEIAGLLVELKGIK